MRSQGVPPPQVKCFTEYLRAAGYYCTNNVKTDYNFPAPATAWDEVSNRAHWRGRPDKNMPFFSVINLVVTHESQIRAPEEARKKNLARLRPEELHDPARAPVPPYYPDTPVVRRDIANYYDVATAMDENAGRILKDLEDDGLAENTAVFYWGDHGWGMTRGKRWPYDSGIHVPLVVRWPGQVAPGTSPDRMVSLMDLGPTVISMAGVKPPAHMHGRAFLGAHEATPRKYIFAARDRMDETHDTIRAVRDSRFKYIRNYHPDRPYAQYISYMDEMPTLKEMRRVWSQYRLSLDNPSGSKAVPKPPQGMLNFFADAKPVEELYDCQADPHEVKNLAGDPALKAKLAELRSAHEQWKKDQPDLGLLPEAELKEKMRPGGVWQKTATPVIKRGAKVEIACTTPGASIAYRVDGGRWLLYAGPFEAPGKVTAKACRLGYLDSEEAGA
jgi:uncharacterized sulfatase